MPNKKNETEKKVFSCRLPADLIASLKNLSRLTGISQSVLTQNAIRMLINKPEMEKLVLAINKADLSLGQADNIRR